MTHRVLRPRTLLTIAGAGVGLVSVATPGFAATSPTPSTIGDACLVGRWVESHESAPGIWTWNNQVIALQGLAGAVVTFTPDGIERVDLSGAQPLIGDYQGHQIKAVLYSGAAYHAHADGRQITLVQGAVDNPVTLYYDGAPQPISTAPYVPGGGLSSATRTTNRYSCGPAALRIELTATDNGQGPVVDLFQRLSSSAALPQSASGSAVSTVGSTLATPSAVVASPITLLVGALAALALVLLVTFPSHLFNRTFEENHDAIRKWWEQRVPWLQRMRRRVATRGDTTMTDAMSFIAVILVGGVLAALLDPHFGPNTRTAALFVGAVFALLAGSLVSAGSAGLYRVLRGGTGPWRLHALPSGLVVAAACVLISRLVAFQPGYLYGLIGGIVFSQALSSRQQGHVVAVSSIATLIVAFAAWLLWVPVSSFSSSHPTSFGWALASNFLAALFVSGMVGLLIGLVPLRFLPGEKLAGWHRGVWGAVFGLAALAVIEVMLRPQSAGAHVASVPFWTTAGLFVGFGAASIMFWSYFRLRKAEDRPQQVRAVSARRK